MLYIFEQPQFREIELNPDQTYQPEQKRKIFIATVQHGHNK